MVTVEASLVLFVILRISLLALLPAFLPVQSDRQRLTWNDDCCFATNRTLHSNLDFFHDTRTERNRSREEVGWEFILQMENA